MEAIQTKYQERESLEKIKIWDIFCNIEIIIKKNFDYTSYSFFFKNTENNLISYFSVYTMNWQDDIFYIKDMTNWNWFEKMSNEMKFLYLENWYDPNFKIKNFSANWLKFIYDYMRKIFPNIRLICVNWLEKNKSYIEIVLRKFIEKTWDSLAKILWWWEFALFTIKLDK